MPDDGWEFFILDPRDKNLTNENTQEQYIKNYNSAYNKLLQELCIPNPNDLLVDLPNVRNTFLYYINCEGENDKINLETDYEYTFLKSIFMEKKFNAIKKCLKMYYRTNNIIINKIYKNDSNYYIELEKDSNNSVDYY